MGALLDQAGSETSLMGAWNDLRLSLGRRDGAAQEAFKAFESSAASRIARMSNELLSGGWRPSPVRRIVVPKPSGGRRLLGVPPIADRVVERAVLEVLDPVIDPELLPWSFAYRRGLGAPDALRTLCESRDEGNTWVARVDIKDCFDSVPRRSLLRRVATMIDDAEMVELLRLLVYRPVAGHQRSSPRGLHQGSVLSPLLTNLYLDELDRRLLSDGLRPVRYADDLAIAVSDAGSAHAAMRRVQTRLEEIGLAVNHAKSSCVSFDQGVAFLGQTVSANGNAGGRPTLRPEAISVFVTDQGSLLRRKGQRLVIEQSDGERRSIGIHRVRQVVAFGRVGVTTPAIHQFLSAGTDVVFLSNTGHFFGRLTGTMSSNPLLRRSQYDFCGDPDVRLNLARRIVMAKIANMRVFALRAARRSGELRTAGAVASRLARHRRLASQCGQLNELLGLEGAASRDHFGIMRQLVGPGFDFEARRRRPPPDPVNSMLSFGYTLLVQEIIGAVESAGLDPYAGFLHTIRSGTPSLALDLVEEFRPVLVDTVVVHLTRGVLSPDDFTSTDGRCLLGHDARRTFLAAYERRMLTPVTHPQAGRRVTYRVALGLQAKALADEISGSVGRYRPMVWK